MSVDRNPATVIVLGATGGIGSELSRRLAARGDRLVLAARRAEPLRELAAELDAEARELDATDPEAVDTLVAETLQRAGRVDGIANLVGSILLQPAHRTSLEQWRETLALNLDTAFHVVRAAGTHLRKSPVSVVLMSSAAAARGLRNHEAIAAAKAGVEGLTRAAAASYAGRGLRVNAVAPGLVDTAMAEPVTSTPAALKASESMHPLGRIGTPADVASAVAWLLDPAQSWVTGQVLSVDGGLAHVSA